MEFLHAYIPIDMVRMSQTFQKTSESKDPSTWSFFMRTNMTQMAVPQAGGTIITILYLLA